MHGEEEDAFVENHESGPADPFIANSRLDRVNAFSFGNRKKDEKSLL